MKAFKIYFSAILVLIMIVGCDKDSDTATDTAAEEVSYTVKYDTDGGSEIANATVTSGNKATKPTNPTKEGYAFKEWQLDGVAFDFENTTITKNITLKAIWNAALYTVKYNTYGGSKIAEVKVNSGSKATKPTNPIKDGNVFKEWQLDGVAFDFENTAITKDITLKAIWELSYTVKYNTDGGSEIAETKVNSGSKATKPTNPTKDAYAFKEWQLDGVVFDFENTTVTKNITLKAIWSVACSEVKKTEKPMTLQDLKTLVNTAISNDPTAHLNYIDVSAITSMESLFDNKSSFNGDISCWDVSSVTNMDWVFRGASSFNQPLDSWDVSSVTSMRVMFSGATSFNQPLNSWDVDSVTNMWSMFSETEAFNQPLDSWNVSKVTNMRSMFSETGAFNQPLSSWNVGSVTDMYRMFYFAFSFDQPLNSWDVSKVTNMSWMFHGTDFNQPLNSWDVDSVTNMSYMFYGSTEFNQPLDSWDVGSVTDMGSMFGEVDSFNQPLNSWNVSSVTKMDNMFLGAKAFNQPLDSWNVIKVTNMWRMFNGAKAFNQDISNWNVVGVTKHDDIFTSSGMTNDAYKPNF